MHKKMIFVLITFILSTTGAFSSLHFEREDYIQNEEGYYISVDGRALQGYPTDGSGAVLSEELVPIRFIDSGTYHRASTEVTIEATLPAQTPIGRIVVSYIPFIDALGARCNLNVRYTKVGHLTWHLLPSNPGFESSMTLGNSNERVPFSCDVVFETDGTPSSFEGQSTPPKLYLTRGDEECPIILNLGEIGSGLGLSLAGDDFIPMVEGQDGVQLGNLHSFTLKCEDPVRPICRAINFEATSRLRLFGGLTNTNSIHGSGSASIPVILMNGNEITLSLSFRNFLFDPDKSFREYKREILACDNNFKTPVCPQNQDGTPYSCLMEFDNETGLLKSLDGLSMGPDMFLAYELDGIPIRQRICCDFGTIYSTDSIRIDKNAENSIFEVKQSNGYSFFPWRCVFSHFTNGVGIPSFRIPLSKEMIENELLELIEKSKILAKIPSLKELCVMKAREVEFNLEEIPIDLHPYFSEK